jgi:cytidylate kinase
VAPDAVVVDTTGKNVEEVVKEVLGVVREKGFGVRDWGLGTGD